MQMSQMHYLPIAPVFFAILAKQQERHHSRVAGPINAHDAKRALHSSGGMFASG